MFDLHTISFLLIFIAAGLVKGVTGIDDPYEEPLTPEIRIDTSELGPSEAAQDVLLYLEGQGYLK